MRTIDDKLSMIDEFEQQLSNVPGLYVKCSFDKNGALSDIDAHPIYNQLIDKMFNMKTVPMYGVFRIVAFMSLLANQNGSDSKSCRVFFEAITCGIAAYHGISKEQYFKDLAEAGYFGTKQ